MSEIEQSSVPAGAPRSGTSAPEFMLHSVPDRLVAVSDGMVSAPRNPSAKRAVS
jgi:hypothetical protein